MKDKLIMFIIGVLVGCVLSTGGFYFYNSASNCDCNQIEHMGEPPEKPNGENETPPEKPNGENKTPPEKPSGETIENQNEGN